MLDNLLTKLSCYFIGTRVEDKLRGSTLGIPFSDSTNIGSSIGQVVAIQPEWNPPGNDTHTGLSDVSIVQPTSMGQTLGSEQGFLIHSAIGGHGSRTHSTM